MLSLLRVTLKQMVLQLIYKNTQIVDGSTSYDALELLFNSIDNPSTLKIQNVDISQSINHKVVRNYVCTKSDIDLKLF